MQILLWVILIVILIGLFYDFESLRRARQQISKAWSSMNWCMEQKQKTVLKLLDVGSYFLYEEQEYVKRISDSVHSVKNPDNLDEKFRADRVLEEKLNGFFLKLKGHPELKKLQAFRELMKQFEDLDKRAVNASNTYNEIATHHNRRIGSFPSKMIAMLFKFNKYPTR